MGKKEKRKKVDGFNQHYVPASFLGILIQHLILDVSLNELGNY